MFLLYPISHFRYNYSLSQQLELEHKHQLELQQKQFENQLGGDVINTLFSEAMKMPEVKKQISQGMNAVGNKRR